MRQFGTGSIVLTGSGGGTDPYLGPESNSIPVTLRSLVDIDHRGAFQGTFSGRVIGGNGRSLPCSEGQVAYYQFNAGPGRKSITATVSLTNDPQENFGLYLIDPNGVAAGNSRKLQKAASRRLQWPTPELIL